MKPKNVACLILGVVFLLVLICAKRASGAGSAARSYTLRWDDPNPSALVSGYRIYKWESTNWVRLGETTSTFWGIQLTPGSYRLGVTAVGKQGLLESEHSAPLDLDVIIAVINLSVTQP